MDCIMANRDKRVVPGTGIEPVRSKIEGFSYHFGFRRQHVCCSWSGARLHHSLTTVGARRLLSTPSQSCKTGLGSALARMSKHPGLSPRSEEHTSELQSLMRSSYAVFCLKQTPANSVHTTNTRMK